MQRLFTMPIHAHCWGGASRITRGRLSINLISRRLCLRRIDDRCTMRCGARNIVLLGGPKIAEHVSWPTAMRHLRSIRHKDTEAQWDYLLLQLRFRVAPERWICFQMH